MSNVLVAELLFKVISYLSTFFLNNKKRKKCRTKRKKCRTKGQNVDLCKISIRHFNLRAKKGKNVEQKGKNVDFSKFLFDIFSSITKKGKNVEQFDIFVFDIFL